MTRTHEGAEGSGRAAPAAAEQQRDAIEQRFRLMADAVPQIVWVTDAQGRVEFFNRQWADYTGVPYEPTTAAAVAAAFVHPDDGAATLAAFDAARRTGGPFAVEHRIRSAAGDYRWFLVRAEPYRDPATGEIVQWFGASVDIHDRKLADDERTRLLAELSAERERLRGVIRQAPVPMALHEGPEHRYVLVNDAYKRVSGGGRDVTGLTLREAFPEVAGQGLYEVFDQVYATGESWAGPETHLHYDRLGTAPDDAWFHLRYEPVRDETGQVTGILNFSVDVTDQVLARREVERLLAASERARADAEAARAEAERTTQQLQDQAAEMELQAEELQATAARLEERSDDAEQARRLAEAERARAAGILEAMADAYFALDADFRIVAVNAAMERGTGLGRDALLGRVFWEMFPGTVGTEYERHYRAAATEGVTAHFTDAYDDGRLTLVSEADVYPVTGGGVAVFWRDITARMEAEAERDRLLAAERAARAEAEAARARTDAVLASIGDAFYLLDREWRFTHVNDAAEPLLQTRRDQLLGRTLWEAFPGVVGSVFEGPYREAMATGRITSAEAYFEPLGTWFDVRSYPWAGGLMVHFRDIGARKAAEAERERLLADAVAARAEAEVARVASDAANQAKSQFLAVMSHELRTPLNAIGGYAELIELGIHGPVTDAQRTSLARIQRSQRHLLGLINGVLDYARVEAGVVAYEAVDVPVAEAVAEAEALVAPQLRAKGLGYAWSGAAPAVTVRADREKLQQILLNVLGNAIKFTDGRDGTPGRVEVSCTVEEGVSGSPSGGLVRLQVRDTGAGIAAEALERIFEPFVQADQRLTRPHAGVGLGLAISRDLARGMGGDLSVESTLGQGSVFTLVLPRGSAPSV
jgi:PAS domain S-box-containing protein